MRHSHTSRGLKASAKTLLAIASLGLAAACSDSVSTPVNQVSVKAPAGFNAVLGTKVFTYNPKTGVTMRLADNVIVIPANAVCDLLTSGYGVSLPKSTGWDTPCNAAKNNIVITATMFADKNGAPYVDFQPAMRFSPDKIVNIYLRDGKRSTANMLTINWCNNAGLCIDESKTDSSLVTHRVGRSAILVRRVKHFSGYSVGTGPECTDGTVEYLDDGSLWCNTDGGGSRDRSGYMLASGLSKTGTSTARRGKKYDQ